MRILVVGGGVIGTSIAYQLAARGAAVTLIERSGIACAASGKSGGFLALDWCDGTPLMTLARRSFALHAGLAEKLGNSWGYRRLTTLAGTAAADARAKGPSRDWLSAHVTITGCLGSPPTTAQVDPAAFTAAMMRAAQDRGATLRIGRVTGLRRQGERIVGVAVDGETVEADATVFALGPWSPLATDWLPVPQVFGLKGHSLVFETGGRIPPEALFLDYRESRTSALTPEIFPRADGTTYVCAISSQAPVPVDPADVAPDLGAIERLEALCRRISPVLAESPIRARQACFRPVIEDGLPLIGAVPGTPGAFIATGHSVWGILNAPATAEAMAELMLDGRATTVDLSLFDPGRFKVNA